MQELLKESEICAMLKVMWQGICDNFTNYFLLFAMQMRNQQLNMLKRLTWQGEDATSITRSLKMFCSSVGLKVCNVTRFFFRRFHNVLECKQSVLGWFCSELLWVSEVFARERRNTSGRPKADWASGEAARIKKPTAHRKERESTNSISFSVKIAIHS